MISMSSTSTEYVKVRISATKLGLAVNPTLDTVQMAFTTTEGVSPTSGWQTAIWETAGTPTVPVYLACCLVGPGAGGVVLAVGPGMTIYQIWVKVTDNPEIPVKPAGELQITP